ncbi:MAG: SPOR domain-containing protein [Trueperaceae bacterium]|nr:SPOR domain-containing protein [Trueperaceae bacterium]
MRRNWPDLLIGLALIAVIAGIVATLLTGGSFFPLGGPTVQPQPSSPSVSTPAPDVAPPAGGDEATRESDGPDVAVLPPSTTPADTTPPGAPSTDVAEDTGAEAAPSQVTPLSPDASDGDAAASDEDAAGAAPETAAAAGDAAATPAAPSTPSTTPSSTPSTSAQPSTASDPAPSAPYRVAVGAFSQRENAEAQAARFRASGYPVFIAAQDALTLVLVGPYDDETVAQRVAAEIRSGDYDVDPVIYLFEPDDGTSSAAPDADAASATTSEASTAAAPESSPTASRAPEAESQGTRLQAGAYADPEAAQPQIERLQSLGFAVQTVSEGGFVKLLVGPFTGGALTDARVILDGAGIEYFAR